MLRGEKAKLFISKHCKFGPTGRTETVKTRESRIDVHIPADTDIYVDLDLVDFQNACILGISLIS